MQVAARVGLDLQITDVAIEIDGDIARFAHAETAGQRLRHARRNLLRGDGAARARDDDFGQAAGVDVDELMRPDRLDDAVGRHRAAGAEVGRAEDRHVGHRAGIVDQVADMHDVAGDGDVGAQRRRSALRRGGIGDRRREREQQTESEDAGADHDQDLSQRISCAVVCSISSAAVITLEFIS